jgi:hypothetical protein
MIKTKKTLPFPRIKHPVKFLFMNLRTFSLNRSCSGLKRVRDPMSIKVAI